MIDPIGQLFAVLQVKTLKLQTYGLGFLWLLRGHFRSTGGSTNTEKKEKQQQQKTHWVGPVARAWFLEGDMEALRASLCRSVFSLGQAERRAATRRDPPPPPLGSWTAAAEVLSCGKYPLISELH